MKLKELLELRAAKKKTLSVFQEQASEVVNGIDEINVAISEIIADPVRQSRTLTAKDTGTVDVLVQGIMVKHNVPRFVKWDQEKLKLIRKKIRQHNDDPDEYMSSKTTFKVTEKVYKSMPGAIKSVFNDAREVKAGVPKVTFDMRDN